MVPREGNGPAQRKWSCTKEMFPRTKEMVPPAKEMVPREGNSPARYGNGPAHEGNSPAHDGNGPTHNGNSPTRKGNSPTQRKWSRIAFQSAIETPSQWDRCLLGNHGAYSAPVQHLFQPMRGHGGRSRVQSAHAKAPTTH